MGNRCRTGTARHAAGGARLGVAAGGAISAFTRRTKTTWSEVCAAMQAGRRNGIHAEEGEIDLFLGCYATPLQHDDRDEKLALAVSFEAGRPESDRRLIRQALQREWREFSFRI
jgi:DNA-binding IclR family transcriptional regulator